MTRTVRIEGITQVVILLVMAVMAVAALITHIHDVVVGAGHSAKYRQDRQRGQRRYGACSGGDGIRLW